MAAADDLQVSDLGWPADTTQATFKQTAAVRAEPGKGKRLANAKKGARVTWRRIVASRDACKGYLELDRGWACATDLAPAKPDDKPADAPQVHWAKVADAGADAYDDLEALRAGIPSRHIDHADVVLKSGIHVIDGGKYVWTDQGWIAAGDVTVLDPSAWAGFALKPGAKLDFGWAVAKKPGAKIPVRKAADDKAEVVRELSPRDMVQVFEVSGEWARVGEDEWTLVVELRRPEKRARPEGVGLHEKWIDVDLDQQVLMLYEGDTPVFTTLVSTGRLGLWQTPTGLYRIRDKEEKARMQYTPETVIPGVTESWDVADVPYVMGFRRNFALHGTYWHDGFGRQRSHGCVNLSPQDAKTVYDFALPYGPDGFTDIEADGDGTPVQLRDRKDPNPKWLDYDGHALADVATK